MGLFWKDPTEKDKEKEAPKKEAVKTVKSTPASKSIPSLNETTEKTTTSTVASTITPTSFVQAGTESPEFTEYFKKVFEEANLPGPDYHEFVNALEFLKSQPIPDQQKFMSVFAGFIAQGCTKKRLIESANTYIQLFTEKKDKFEQALDASYAEAVGSRESEVERLNAENAKLDEQMQKLAEQKVKNGEAVAKLTTEISEESNRLKMKHANFTATFERMTKEIQDNSKKIEEYLPN